MSEYIVKGPCKDIPFGDKSLGMIYYETLRAKEAAIDILVDGDNGESISYGKFFETSVRFAKFLKTFGVKEGEVVAIVAENSWRYLVGVVSCFYIGATVFLLNPDYTSRELKHFFEISPPTLLFCTNRTQENLKGLILEDSIINLDCDVKNFENLNSFEPVDSNVFKPALMITSSGTQGFPKVVVLTQENIKNSFPYVEDANILGFNKEESTIGYLPFFHIFGVLTAIGAILYGTKVIVLDKFRPEKFLSTIQVYKISKLLAVPPILQFLVKSPLVDSYDLSSIRDVVCGAARITEDLEEMVEKRLNITSVRQLYGMSESACATLTPKNRKKTGSVGQVVTNAAIKVCDTKTGRALPPHELGEVRIKGGGVMVGYKDNEEQTKEAFDEEGFLKSGDLGYYDEDYFFYIVDRLKDVIKYKGFQVSPAELETILIQHPGVGDVGVVGVPDEKVGEVPVAFVVKQKGVEVTEKDLVEFVAGNISVQKRLYGGVRFVEEIPRNASGKILRRKLREFF